jgi:hypothetical protein
MTTKQFQEEMLEIEKKKLKALETIAHATLYLYNWFEEIDKDNFVKGFDEYVNYIKRIR